MANSNIRTVGILGGGQLGDMLSLAAPSVSLRTVILTPGAGDPAVRSADEAIVAPFSDLEAVRKLAQRADVITYEIETIPPQTLELLEELRSSGVCEVAPRPDILALIQNKATQKQWFAEQGLPTADFEVFDHGIDDPAALPAKFGLPFVQKSQRDGYDGRGVQVIKDAAGCESLWQSPSLVERFVPHQQEIAVLVARNSAGEMCCYDPVGLRFDSEDSILEFALAPADLEPELGAAAIALGKRVVQAFDGIGLFAVELFVTLDNELLINEISPRVHNAGHHTIEACETSQFEQHLRAVSGLPLASTALKGHAAMRNVLYEDAMAPLCLAARGVDAIMPNGAWLHWYGKTEGRHKRKMGHITAVAQDQSSAIALAEGALDQLIADGFPENGECG